MFEAIVLGVVLTTKTVPKQEDVVTLAAALFENAKKLPPPHPAKETPEEYESRIGTITLSTAKVAASWWPEHKGRWMIGNALLSLTYGETRWDLDLHAGPDQNGNCADGRPAKTHRRTNERRCLGDGGRAIGLGQLHDTPVVPSGKWASLAGTSLEATTANLEVSVSILFRALRYCGSEWSEEGLARAYTLYGTGAVCKPTAWARHRARRWALMVAGKKPTKDAATAFFPSLLPFERVKELPSLLPGPLADGNVGGVYFLSCKPQGSCDS